MKHLRTLALALSLLSMPAVAGEAKIEIREYSYVPNNLTVPAGTKVTWVNHDETAHTVNDAGPTKLFNSAALDTDDSYSFTFTEPGTYKYFCHLHPKMVGTITVTPTK